MSLPANAFTPPRAPFIVLEGVDGSGKSTQARALADRLQAHGIPTLLTREPGGTALAERLRAIILDPAVACTSRAELLMILAARAQHVDERIAPALAAGTVVISDRFSLSSLVYQGIARGLPLDEVRAADAVATGGLRPDLTLVLDVPLEIALQRLGKLEDRFEGEGQEFLRRVVDGYRQLAGEDPTIVCLDGTESREHILHLISTEVDRLLASRRV